MTDISATPANDSASPLPDDSFQATTALKNARAAAAGGDLPDLANPIERSGGEEAMIRESAKDLNRKRQREESDPWAEYNAPIVERRYSGREGAKSLKEATRDLSTAHRFEKPDVRAAVDLYGGDPAEVAKRAQDPKFAEETFGLTPQQAAHWARSGEAPPQAVPLWDRVHDREVRPLRDNAPVEIADSVNLRDSVMLVKDGRQAQALQQQAVLAELTQQQELQQTEQAKAVEAQQAQEQRVASEKQRVADIEQERARLAQERQAVSEMQRWTQAELKAAEQTQTWAQNLNAQPEVAAMMNGDVGPLQRLQQTNPARFAEIQRAMQHGEAWHQQWGQASQVRQARESQIVAAHNAQAQAVQRNWNTAQDAEFTARLAREMPEFSKPEALTKLRSAVKAMLNEQGLSDAQIKAEWDRGRWRSAPEQLIIARSAAYRLAQQRARELTKAGIPPVQRPGTFRPAGAASEDTIRNIERQLETAQGDKAIKLATRLTQLRRSA